MNDLKIIKVIIRTPLWRDFDYLLPEHLSIKNLPIGVRVLVPFGKRQVVGIIAKHLDKTSIDQEKLKFIIDVLDDCAYLDAAMLRLSAWASDYYHYPLGETVFAMLPKKCRQVRKISAPELAVTHNANLANASNVSLSAAQKTVVDQFFALSGYGTLLLHGVTGSGKTEVYLRIIEACLKRGQQALVLVPEISLTPQTAARFIARFNVETVLLHSGLKESERLTHWLAATTGQARIVIGTRLAVFTPLPSLGVIVIDEEHDASFKQQSGFRYSARDVAVVRGHQMNVPVILGSATPSLESLHNAWSGRYIYGRLPLRAGESTPPKIQLLDVRQVPLEAGLSPYLLATIERHLQGNGQVLIFINRRGFAPVMMCHQCGYAERCPHCDTYLTYHQRQHQLRCHHCDFAMASPTICQQCHQADMIPIGFGTEQITNYLAKKYPQYGILRIDRDVARKRGAINNLLNAAHAQSAQILVGTQMLAKGHHFKNLTLVAVVDADNGLHSSDFRGLERLAQLLIQVAGRAGRESRAGEVVIQTHHPNHPMLQGLLASGYSAFAKNLLDERKAAGLPPHTHMAIIHSEAISIESAMAFLQQLKQRLQALAFNDIAVLGPVEATMMRRKGKCRAQLWLQSTDRRQLQVALARLMQDPWVKQQRRKKHWTLDVDPLEVV